MLLNLSWLAGWMPFCSKSEWICIQLFVTGFCLMKVDMMRMIIRIISRVSVAGLSRIMPPYEQTYGEL